PETELLIFASSNAVKIFFQLLRESGQDTRALHKTEICAIGVETSRCLEGFGIRSDLVAEEYTAEGLGRALEGRDLHGSRVLIPRAEIARDALPRLLSRRGANVEALSLYHTLCPSEAEKMLKDLLAGEWVDIVTFTSSSTVSNFINSLGPELLAMALARSRVACIGPVTAETAEELGVEVDIIAREYTAQGLAAAIVEAIRN
ncbi:MAG: uroporphyrinogen-III synthase, partial [Candidatus Dormibacteraceae bacterium]